MDKVEKLKNRQLARLLNHLEKTGQLTLSLEKDVKRAFRFMHEDIMKLLNQDVRKSRTTEVQTFGKGTIDENV